jgi:hypothetical protein
MARCYKKPNKITGNLAEPFSIESKDESVHLRGP